MPPEQTTLEEIEELIRQQGLIITDGIELIRRMSRIGEPWRECEVKEWVRRTREALRAKDA